jgi:hypothetical protein
VAQVVECLPSKHEVPRTAKENQTKKTNQTSQVETGPEFQVKAYFQLHSGVAMPGEAAHSWDK